MQNSENDDYLDDEYTSEFEKEIVGEKQIISILNLIFYSKFVINKNPLSFNTILNSQSGVGKDFVLSRVVKCLTETEDYEEYTKISPRALDYLHANEAGFTWDNKFLILHDVEEETLNCPTMKLFMSEGSKTAIVDSKGNAIVRKVVGRPTIIMTTAFSEPNHEILRRVNLVNLDESPEQTRKIILHYAERELKSDNDTVNDVRFKINVDKIKLAPSLKHIVNISFAPRLAVLLLSENCENHVHMRTFFPKLLDFIRAQAVQRYVKLNKAQKIEAVPEDYEEIRHLFNERFSYTLGYRPLSLTRKKFFDLIKRHFGEGAWFTVKDVESVSSMSYDGVRKQIKNLFEDDFLESQLDRDNHKPVIEYKLKSMSNVKLPSLLSAMENDIVKEKSIEEFNNVIQDLGIEEIN